MYLRRFGVLPERAGPRHRGRLIDAAVEASDGFDDLTVVAREELPATSRSGSGAASGRSAATRPNVELRRPLRTFLFDVPDAEAMRALGESLADQLRAGDLLVLSGELGAGKTTFTQGIGARARGARRRHLADVRDRAGAPLARSTVRRWSTLTPTGSAASTSSTTSTSTPRSTTR